MRILGKLAGLLGLLARYYTKRGRYSLAAGLYPARYLALSPRRPADAGINQKIRGMNEAC